MATCADNLAEFLAGGRKEGDGELLEEREGNAWCISFEDEASVPAWQISKCARLAHMHMAHEQPPS